MCFSLNGGGPSFTVIDDESKLTELIINFRMAPIFLSCHINTSRLYLFIGPGEEEEKGELFQRRARPLAT